MGYLLFSYFGAMIVLILMHFTAGIQNPPRQWSMYVHSNFLVGNSGLCRLIYFAPKHFGSYRLYEVVIFFWCYACNIVNTVLLVIALVHSDMISVATWVNVVGMVASYLMLIVDTVVCDINNYRCNKYFASQPIAQHEYCWAVDRFCKRNKTVSARAKGINFYKNYRQCNFVYIDEEYSTLELDGVRIKCRTWPCKDLSEILTKILPKK